MSVYKEIKTGLEQAIAYEKQSITDKEIKKALECCSKPVGENCKECPLHLTNCLKVNIDGLALDYINRLEAENERLTAEREKLLKECEKCGNKTRKCIVKLQKQIKQAKAEARKEFAERLEPKLANNTDITMVGYQSIIDDIENLLKEMESEDK